jgi:hypothetical protein
MRLPCPARSAADTSAGAFGLGRTKSHELARADEFPCAVLRLGKRYAVTKAAIFEGLGLAHLLTEQARPQAKTA